MATLGDLKTRVIRDTDRNDLGAGEESEGVLDDAIAEAIGLFSDELFWFKHASGTVSTTAGVATVALPAAVRIAETVSYLGQPLRQVQLEAIEAATDSGVPSSWAENGDNIQLWPIPDGVYALSVYGEADVAVPGDDAASTIWTNEAYDLIAAATKRIVFTTFKDFQAAQAAQAVETQQLSRLRRESMFRASAPLQSTGDEPWSARSSFNINRGDF